MSCSEGGIHEPAIYGGSAKIKSMVSPTTTMKAIKFWRGHERGVPKLADHAMANQPMVVVALPIGEGAPRVQDSKVNDFTIIVVIVVTVKTMFL
jgi:hypothetical protein